MLVTYYHSPVFNIRKANAAMRNNYNIRNPLLGSYCKMNTCCCHYTVVV